MKTFKIEIPKGYEIDKVSSTFENIVFKEISSPMDEVFAYHNTTEKEFEELYKNVSLRSKYFEKEALIVSYYNKGRKVEFTNANQKKYYPYFYSDVFRLVNSFFYYAFSSMPASLCFLRKEDLEEAVEKFLPEYKQSRTTL